MFVIKLRRLPGRAGPEPTCRPVRSDLFTFDRGEAEGVARRCFREVDGLAESLFL
jgi:hypothetical protein